MSLMILELSPSNITFSGWLGFIVMMDVWICCRNEKVVENIVNMRKIYRGIMGIAMVKTFKSRWATLWLWRCCTPSRICLMKKLACNEYFSAKVQQIFQAQNDKEIIFMDIPYIIIFIVIIVIIVLIINVIIIMVTSSSVRRSLSAMKSKSSPPRRSSMIKITNCAFS